MFSWTNGIKYLERQADKIIQQTAYHAAGSQQACATKQNGEPKKNVDSGKKNGRSIRLVHCKSVWSVENNALIIYDALVLSSFYVVCGFLFQSILMSRRIILAYRLRFSLSFLRIHGRNSP